MEGKALPVPTAVAAVAGAETAETAAEAATEAGAARRLVFQ
jgi:hypothetical protein